MSDPQLHRPGLVMKPEPGSPIETEGAAHSRVARAISGGRFRWRRLPTLALMALPEDRD